MELYSNLFISFVNEKSYFSEIVSLGLKFTLPNILEFFLFIVLLMGMSFSSLNLRTVASLKSKYSSISVISFLTSIFSFIKSNPNVTDSPDSTPSPILSLLILKILSLSILLSVVLWFFISCGLALKDIFGIKLLTISLLLFISGNSKSYLKIPINSD